MNKIISAVLMVAAMVGVASADDGTGAILAKLKEKYPATTFTSVKQSEVAGVYEVMMAKNMAYTDASGRYFIIGRLFDMQTQTDLSSERLAEADKIDFNALPLKDAIKRVKGDGSRKLALFSDPDCPFCKRVESTIAQLDNVTVYIFPYPLEQLHPEAVGKSIAIWCAKDRLKAWDDYLFQGKLPAAGKCDNPISRNVALGQSLGINGTPFMITGTGRKIAGALPLEKIEAAMAGGASSVKVTRQVGEGK